MREDWSPFKGVSGRVRLVLQVEWDPIGIFGFPGALGQYDRYAVEITTMLEQGANETEIENYLYETQRDRISVGLGRERLKVIAKRLVRLREDAREFGGDARRFGDKE